MLSNEWAELWWNTYTSVTGDTFVDKMTRKSLLALLQEIHNGEI